jgi:hypothetical protein
MSKRGKDYMRDAAKLARSHPSAPPVVFFESVRAPTQRVEAPPQGDPPGEYGKAVRQLRRNTNSAIAQLTKRDVAMIEEVRNGGGRAAFEKHFGMIWKLRNHGKRSERARGQRLLRIAQRYLPEYLPGGKGVTS